MFVMLMLPQPVFFLSKITQEHQLLSGVESAAHNFFFFFLTRRRLCNALRHTIGEALIHIVSASGARSICSGVVLRQIYMTLSASLSTIMSGSCTILIGKLRSNHYGMTCQFQCFLRSFLLFLPVVGTLPKISAIASASQASLHECSVVRNIYTQFSVSLCRQCNGHTD